MRRGRVEDGAHAGALASLAVCGLRTTRRDATERERSRERLRPPLDGDDVARRRRGCLAAVTSWHGYPVSHQSLVTTKTVTRARARICMLLSPVSCHGTRELWGVGQRWTCSSGWASVTTPSPPNTSGPAQSTLGHVGGPDRARSASVPILRRALGRQRDGRVCGPDSDTVHTYNVLMHLRTHAVTPPRCAGPPAPPPPRPRGRGSFASTP